MKFTQIIKRSMGILLAFSMILGSLYISGISVKAEETLQANQEVQGTITKGQSITYNFIMPKKGYFSFRLSNSANFLSVKMQVNYKTWENEPFLSHDNPFISSSYAFKPGTKVQIILNNTYNTMDYSLCVDVKNIANFESENNDTKAKSDTIKVKKTYTGLIMKDDADWYVFKAPKDGKYKIRGVVPDTGVVNFSSYKGYKEIISGDLQEGKGYKTFFSGKLKKGQKIYMKISYSTLWGKRGVFYKIQAQEK